MSIYETLCELGPALIDDSRRTGEAVGLDDDICVFGRWIEVREAVEYGAETDGFANVTYVVDDVMETEDDPKKAAIQIADCWLDEVANYLAGLGPGSYDTTGWRINRRQRKTFAKLVDAVKQEMATRNGGAE